MNVEVENLPNCITTLRVEVPPEKFVHTWDTVARDYAKYAKIPGYRPGKAPRNVIENKFKKQIREEVEKKLLSESCREAINDRKLRVISLADVQDVEVGSDKAMRFTATLVTAPDFELPEYKNIPVNEQSLEVIESDIDAVFTTIQEQNADFTDVVDRSLALDDFAVIDYSGTIEGKPVHEVAPKSGRPLSGNSDFWLKLTPEAIFHGFSENLVGAKIGESRTFDIEVPADFAVGELAGHKITYSVTVKGLKQRTLPELNDEFASKLAPGKTFLEIRELIRGDIEHQKKSAAAQDKKNQIMTFLLSRVECELPANMVRHETKRILADIVRENQHRGIADDLLKENEKQLVETATKGARERLKGNFILLRIAEEQNFKVTKDEFDRHLDIMSSRYQISKEKLLKELSDRGALEQINEEILTAKTLDFLASNATVSAKSQTGV